MWSFAGEILAGNREIENVSSCAQNFPFGALGWWYGVFFINVRLNFSTSLKCSKKIQVIKRLKWDCNFSHRTHTYDSIHFLPELQIMFLWNTSFPENSEELSGARNYYPDFITHCIILKLWFSNSCVHYSQNVQNEVSVQCHSDL